MDGQAVANWMKDAPSVEVRDFVERMLWPLGERELAEIKSVRRAMKSARRDRQAALARQQRENAKALAAKQEAARLATLARQYDMAARSALSASNIARREGSL